MKWKTKITNHSHDKYITTPEFNNLTSARLKQTNLSSKSDIANFVNKTDFDNKPSPDLIEELTQIKQNMYLLKMN